MNQYFAMAVPARNHSLLWLSFRDYCHPE